MIPSALPVVVRGSGPPALFIHGSGTDHIAWTPQLASLSSRFQVIAYGRRGSLAAPHAGPLATADHVADARAILAAHAAGPALVCGSSFGAVVALALARAAPALVSHLVLCEPPLPSHDFIAPVPSGLGCALDELARGRGEAVAAEAFLRTVLGDEVFGLMAPHVRARALATWPNIRVDSRALAAERVDYPALRRLAIPTLLLGGERSPRFFHDTLDALALALPRAELRILAGAGHAMQIDQARAFDRAILEFVART